MVISHKYKYVFVELPRTGTTAITNQLVKFYDGKQILIKHASYGQLKKYYNNDYSDYFVFSCIRNPLDRTVSEFEKLKNDKSNNLHWYFQLRANYLKEKSSFEDYFLKFYKLPYDDWSSLDHKKFDFIIRYESLQEDFQTVLNKLDINQIQKIPMINKTKNKRDYLSYYTPRIKKRATFVFGPYCEKNDYSLPWKNLKISNKSIFLYKTLFVARKIMWIQLKNFQIKKRIKSGKIKI